MRHGRGHGHLAGVSEPRDQCVDDAAGSSVPFDQSDLARIALCLDPAIADRKTTAQSLGRGLIFDDADDPGGDFVRSGRGGNVEVRVGQGLAHVDGVAGSIGPIKMRTVDDQLAALGDRSAQRDDPFDRKRREVRRQDDIRPSPRSDRAKFAFQAKVRRRVDRAHLQRHQRIAAAGDGMTKNAIHVAIVHQRPGHAIIGAQNEIARIEATLGHGCNLCFHVIPSRSQPHHRAHPLPHPGHGIRFAGAFVVICGATGGIGVKCGTEIGRCVMSADGLAGPCGRRHLGQHLRVAVRHARKIHHLAQTDDAGPGHCLGHVVGRDFVPGGFQTGGRRRAGWHLHEHRAGLYPRLVMHQAHTGQAEDVCDFVRVGEHRRGAVRDDGSTEFGRNQHTGFDVHMSVAQAGNDVPPLRFDDFGIRSDAVTGIGANIGEAALRDGDLPLQHLARVDKNDLAAPDHGVGGRASGGDGNEGRGRVGPGRQGLRRHGERCHGMTVCAMGVATRRRGTDTASLGVTPA